MQIPKLVAIPTLAVVIIAAACDRVTDFGRETAGMSQVAVTTSSASMRALKLEQHDPGLARERRVTEILELHPELARDEALMALLRGQLGSTMLVSLDAKYADIAPLIAEVGELLVWEEWRLNQAKQLQRPNQRAP